MFHMPGGSEWLIILVVVLLIFGPKNLPRLGSAMGRFVRNLRAGQRGDAVDEEEIEEESPPPRRTDTTAKS